MAYTLSFQVLTQLGFVRVPADPAHLHLIVWENHHASRRLIFHRQADYVSFNKILATGKAKRIVYADAPQNEQELVAQLAAIEWL